MPGARCTRSRVCSVESTRVSHHGHTGITRHSPRNGFTAYFVLSPVTGLFCHRRQRSCLRRLDSSIGASGPHDFAVRIKRPSSSSASASTASRPALMTLRNAPLWDRTVSDILLIWGKREVEYFCKWGWTGFSDLPVRASPRWVISAILTADR